ncbi:hypothetical protein [Streptomyces sp. NPDC086182]|jgi:hypothetical protein|uniref:hypothetical protein n=1 Tax=Streptomyces sp. NPDC086182 TaxID=3155058 RepID=UPI00344A7E23
MIGLIIRVLPFWVREPLLIAVGFPFSGALFYAAARDGSAFGAFLGAVMLLVSAYRVHLVVKALRARKVAKELQSAAAAAATTATAPAAPTTP